MLDKTELAEVAPCVFNLSVSIDRLFENQFKTIKKTKDDNLPIAYSQEINTRFW